MSSANNSATEEVIKSLNNAAEFIVDRPSEELATLQHLSNFILKRIAELEKFVAVRNFVRDRYYKESYSWVYWNLDSGEFVPTDPNNRRPKAWDHARKLNHEIELIVKGMELQKRLEIEE